MFVFLFLFFFFCFLCLLSVLFVQQQILLLKSEKINGIDGDFGSQERYKALWNELNNNNVNKKIFQRNLSIKESLTISLRYDFSAYEIILRNLGLVYKDNKNKYKNDNKNRNEMIKLQKKILNVIKWLFKQLTNNNKEPFIMRSLILNILVTFTDKIYLNLVNDDNDDDDRFKALGDKRWIPDFSMINEILGYLVDNKIKCRLAVHSERFYDNLNYPDIYRRFLQSVWQLPLEDFESMLSDVVESISDKNDKYYHCLGKYLIECLIKIDQLIVNGYKNTYLYMSKSTIRQVLSAIKEYDDNMNGRNVFSRQEYVYIPDTHIPIIQIFCEHVSPTSHPNIMQLISMLQSRCG